MTLDVVAARPAYSDQRLGGSTTERLSRLRGILDDLRREDAAAERDRVLQYRAVERLRRAGILSLRVPARYGGPGASVRDVLTAVIQSARGSSNVAQALRAHFGFAERLLRNRAPRPSGRSGSRPTTPAWCSETRSPMRTENRRPAPTPRCASTTRE
jgi:hypothetical protein